MIGRLYSTLTYDEWWSAVVWYSGFGIGREHNVDDPETWGVMKPHQKYNQQHRAQASCGSHVSFNQLCCRTALLLGLGVTRGGGRGGQKKHMKSDQCICYITCPTEKLVIPVQTTRTTNFLACLTSFNLWNQLFFFTVYSQDDTTQAGTGTNSQNM